MGKVYLIRDNDTSMWLKQVKSDMDIGWTSHMSYAMSGSEGFMRSVLAYIETSSSKYELVLK